MSVPSDEQALLLAYVQAHPDLLLWLSKSNDRKALIHHMTMIAPAENRLVPKNLSPPLDWSDEFAQRHMEPLASSLWRLGTMQSQYFLAQAILPSNFEALGRLSASPDLSKGLSIELDALPQVIHREQVGPRGVLHAHSRGKFAWAALPYPAIGKFADFIDAQGDLLGAADVVILAPWLETGGAEQVAYWHYEAACRLGLKPVIVCTDSASIAQHYSKMNLFVVNMPLVCADILGVDYSLISIEQRVACLAMLIKSMNPRVVHLIHSYAGYKLAETTALAAALRLNERLLVSTFCPHVHQNGRVDGYFRHIPAIDTAVAAYVFDNEVYLRELQTMYGLEEQRTQAIKYPITPKVTAVYDSNQSPVILWASRLDFQKNPGIVFKIARQMPLATFHVFGRSVLSDDELSWDDAPSNVLYKGEFFGLQSIPLHEYSIFLYTARFDGMPNIILEVAAAGIPIVSSAVGGISEFLGSEEGILVEDYADVEGYVSGLNRLLQDKLLRQSMSEALLRKIKNERMLETFVLAVKSLPIYRDIDYSMIEHAEFQQA
jgi:glycosyltransferase involved in cell wall biosynthesis